MTKEIKLTKGMVALVDDIDYDWLNRWKWCAVKGHKTFYAFRKSGNKDIQMHTLIISGAERVDHKDGDGLNNQRVNLRRATHQQNLMNRGAPINNKSGYKGVSFDRFTGRWVAKIGVSGKHLNIGRFDTPEEAALAYNAAAERFYGEFSYKNEIL